MTDYIIVGCGLAGIAVAETALQRGQSVVVFDDGSQTSSGVAGGLYNPVILKRFSGLQHAQLQLQKLQAFYATVEDRLATVVNHPLPILRRFASVEDQNKWFAASDKPAMADFLSQNLIADIYSGLNSPYGYGEVLQTGYVDTRMLLDEYKRFLNSINAYRGEKFSYSDIVSDEGGVTYGTIKARHIVFAEGFGIKNNPFFSYLPLNGTKGELLVIEAPDLKLDRIVNSGIFILPLGNDRYKIGATYEWTDKSNEPTTQGREELIQRASEVLICNFEIVSHHAGIRPTVMDRKPIMGKHPEIANYYLLNGLGTRGVMLAPYMAEQLLNFIEGRASIAPENDLARFSGSYRPQGHS